MGRRSINTTKSGKYMNPTDQARKEARKRELKKNKKQRIAVRQAVLKSKDALQLLEEASMYDKQEYTPNLQSEFNERVLQGKRKRLLETFDNLVNLYKKEDPEYAKELLRARKEYDKRRHDMMLYHEQVKLAERTKASDIPLPDLPPSQLAGLKPSDIPLPIGISMSLNKGLLKKPISATGTSMPSAPVTRKPPGPPPSPIPDLSDSESESRDPDLSRRIRFAETNIQSSSFAGGLPTSQIPLPSMTSSVAGFPGIIAPGFNPATGLAVGGLQNVAGAVLSAPPTMNPPSLDPTATTTSSSTGAATIEAKPQIKSFVGDSTRFIPTSLKVRRTVKDAHGRLIKVGGGISSTGSRSGGGFGLSSTQRLGSIPGGALGISGSNSSTANKTGTSASGGATSKDAVYEEFMREMEGLL